MSMAVIAWGAAALVYGVFLVWYLPFGRRISPGETDQVMAAIEGQGLEPERVLALRRFFEEDTGRSFVMVNLLQLNEPKAAARRSLGTYERRFMGRLIRMAGFPLFAGRALSVLNVDQWGIEADGWDAAALVRYRCRRDLARMVIDSLQGDTRDYKHAALLRTFAFPVSPLISTGGPCLIVGLTLALIAAVVQIVSA